MSHDLLLILMLIYHRIERIVEHDQQEHIKNERNLLCKLNHDFIVKCYQSFR